MSAISRMTLASQGARRLERGVNRIPAVWRAHVAAVRETTSEAGAPAGVYVTVPRLTGNEMHGPIPWVGAEPGEGDRVIVAAVEGRETDLVVVNPGGKGARGEDAYQVAVREGFTGTEDEWLAQLRGPQGDPGPPGGLTPEDQATLDNAVAEVENVTRVTTRLRPGDETQFRILDTSGRQAFGITEQGDTVVGATRFTESETLRIMDKHGQIALEVDGEGRTHIYDQEAGGGTSQTVTQLHVFLAVGQSNMSGRGRPVDGPVSARIMQFGANRRELEQAPLRLDMVDSPPGTSPATFFAHNYLASQPSNVGVLLIPAARGATVFTGNPENPASGWTWTKGAAPAPEYALYERSVEQTIDAISAAEAEGYTVMLKGALWHQGEGNGGMATETYASRLDALISDYRDDLEHPTLPFVVGQQCPEGMEVNPSKFTVDAAHRDTPARTPYTGFARAPWGGHNEGDTTHFATIGNVHLGSTFADGYVQALGNVHPH